MDGPLTGIAVFTCLVLSTLLGAAVHGRIRDLVVVRGSSMILQRILGVVAVMAAIFLAVTTVSLKSSFDTAGREVKHFSSLVVELDRNLRRAGPPSEAARELLFRYSDRVMKETWRHAGTAGPATEPSDLLLLGELESAISNIPAASPADLLTITEARRLLQGVVETRWALEERTGGSLSPYMLTVLVFWLMLTFASLGFVTPRSNFMVGILLLGALSIGGAVFLLEEYDDPFAGVIAVSSEPVQNALFTMTD
jgi:hypothetical protein